MLGGPVVFNDNALRGTSAWANTFWTRPHSPSRGRTGGREVSTTGRTSSSSGRTSTPHACFFKERADLRQRGGRGGIVFTDEHGAARHLRIPDEEKLSQPYQEGRIKHVRLAVQVAMAGAEPDCSTALSYLRTLAGVRSDRARTFST